MDITLRPEELEGLDDVALAAKYEMETLVYFYFLKLLFYVFLNFRMTLGIFFGLGPCSQVFIGFSVLSISCIIDKS